jgi:hypothetical protein
LSDAQTHRGVTAGKITVNGFTGVLMLALGITRDAAFLALVRREHERILANEAGEADPA